MSGWRIKGTAGAEANRVHELRQRLAFVRSDSGNIRVEAEPAGAMLAELSLEGDTPRLQRRNEAVVLQVNGADWSDGELAIGDEMRIDSLRFLLQAPGLRPDRVLTPQRAPERGGRWAWGVLLGLLVAAALLTAWWLMR